MFHMKGMSFPTAFWYCEIVSVEIWSPMGPSALKWFKLLRRDFHAVLFWAHGAAKKYRMYSLHYNFHAAPCSSAGLAPELISVNNAVHLDTLLALFKPLFTVCKPGLDALSCLAFVTVLCHFIHTAFWFFGVYVLVFWISFCFWPHSWIQNGPHLHPPLLSIHGRK